MREQWRESGGMAVGYALEENRVSRALQKSHAESVSVALALAQGITDRGEHCGAGAEINTDKDNGPEILHGLLFEERTRPRSEGA